MRYDPGKILSDVSSDPHARVSVRIALCGPVECDMAWCANALTVQSILNARGDVVAVADPDKDVAMAKALSAWRAGTPRGAKDYILLWPNGQFLRWDAVIEGIARGSPVVRIVFALLVRGDALGDLVEFGWLGGPMRIGRRMSNLAVDPSPLSGDPVASPDPTVDPARCIVHAVPTLGKTSLYWLAHTIALQIPIGAFGYFAIVQGYEVGIARQRAVEAVLAADPRPAYLFFHGDDMLSEDPLALKKLMILMRDLDLPAVSAIYYARNDAGEPLLWKKGLPTTLRPGVDFTLGDVIEVEGCGMDFCVIRTDLLAKIPMPAFQTHQSLRGGKLSIYGEDAYFWRQFHKATGKRPHVATGIRVGHFDVASGRTY